MTGAATKRAARAHIEEHSKTVELTIRIQSDEGATCGYCHIPFAITGTDSVYSPVQERASGLIVHKDCRRLRQKNGQRPYRDSRYGASSRVP